MKFSGFHTMFKVLIGLCLLVLFSCSDKIQENNGKVITYKVETTQLVAVSYSEFKEFITATNYITDAEKFGWSFVQRNVYDFDIVDGATWFKPDGKSPVANYDLPVTQVSYNDAKAYCAWSNTTLPTYSNYWLMVKKDQRVIVSNNLYPISSVKDYNLVGNVWEITEPDNNILDSVRLSGGSLFCSVHTCNGTSKSRSLYVDKETGNINIGFAVLKKIE